MCVDMHVFFYIHVLSGFVISLNCFCISSHFVRVKWFLWSVLVWVFISKFLSSRIIIKGFWMLVGRWVDGVGDF